jgi:hypothetical protein
MSDDLHFKPRASESTAWRRPTDGEFLFAAEVTVYLALGAALAALADADRMTS